MQGRARKTTVKSGALQCSDIGNPWRLSLQRLDGMGGGQDFAKSKQKESLVLKKIALDDLPALMISGTRERIMQRKLELKDPRVAWSR